MCSATQGMLGETLLCLKMVDVLKIFAALEQHDCETISCTILYRNDDVITSGCNYLLQAEAINSCKQVLQSKYSREFVWGVRKPFPDDQGNVSVIDTRNNAHWADSNQQFIWVARHFFQINKYCCSFGAWQTRNRIVRSPTGRRNCFSNVHVSSRSVRRLNPTSLVNGTQNFR